MGTSTLLVALLSGLMGLLVPGAAAHDPVTPTHRTVATTDGVAASAATSPPESGGAASRSRMALGVSMLPYDDLSVLDDFTDSVGGSSRRPAIWSVWSDWLGPNRDFPYDLMQGLRDRGVTPMVFWSPDNPTNLNGGEVTYKKIINGQFDDYIRKWAKDAKAWGYPVVIRFAHEFDGSWFPWSVGRFGSTGAQFVAAWQHIVTIFRGDGGVGAKNVRFLWSPWFTGNRAATMYPGKRYVDYVGFTGLNWSDAHHPWRSMANLYRDPIAHLNRIAPGKPVIVAEAGSVDKVVKGDSMKPTWIKDGYEQVYKQFPSLVAIVYFNINIPHQADWRLTTPKSALSAYRAIAANRHFQGKLSWDVALPPVAHQPTASLDDSGKAKSPRVTISWVAAQSARGVASYKLLVWKDGEWSTNSRYLGPVTSKVLKLDYGHTYKVRMRATDVRGHRSHLVTSQPFSVTLTDQTDPAVQFSSGFTEATVKHASGGTVTWSAHKGSTAAFAFTGRSIALVSTRGPNRGKATITIDGEPAGVALLYNRDVMPDQVVYAASLSPGRHTIVVKVVKAGSTGAKRVDVDAFVVMP